jgi:hypothetical protein
MHRHPFTPSPPRDPAVVPSLHIVIPLSSIPAPHASFKTESGRLHGQGKRRAVRPSEPDMSQPGKTGQKVVARVRFTAATRVDLSFNAADMRLLSMHACSWERLQMRSPRIYILPVCTTTSAVRLCSLSSQLPQQGYASRSSEPDVVKWLPSQINISSASSRPQKPSRESTCEVFALS